MKRIVGIVVLSTLSLNSFSQLITSPVNPQWIISSDFLGGDYTVSNVTYSGVPYAIGSFDATATVLGLTKGIVMTTGTITDNGDGPNGPNNLGDASVANGAPGYYYLDSLFNGNTYNASVLEFDFTTASDSISLNYSFGSEEYPEYVGSAFGDGMVILLSGPGILGTQNLAILQNGDFIHINNVNSTNFASNYQSNGDGAIAPYNTDPYYIQYDGFTIGLVAKYSGLQIGQTYHLVIAIADTGDSGWDSGVFIESCASCNFTVGEGELKKVGELKCYPNPSSGSINVTLPEMESGSLTVYRIDGAIERQLIIKPMEESLEIDQLTSGIYIIKLKSSGYSWTEKIIVQ